MFFLTHCTAANADMCSIFIILDLSSAFGASGRNVVNSSRKKLCDVADNNFLDF